MAEKKLSLKSERFCQNWVDTVGSGTLAALLSYDIEGKEILEQGLPYKEVEDKKLTLEQKEEQKQYYEKKRKVENVAASMASQMLRRIKITNRIDIILEERGFEDKAVKREHFKIIKQGRDDVKMRSIDSYYKLKGKNEPEKHEHTVIDKFNYIKPENDKDNSDNKTPSETG